MTNPLRLSLHGKGTVAFWSLAILALMLVAGGCTSPSQQARTSSPVAVTQPDSSTILVTYPGSTATGDLLEMEVTVTDSAGKIQTQSVGDRYSTTPLKFGSTLPVSGAFGGSDHVLVTGYFMDGSQRVLQETTI